MQNLFSVQIVQPDIHYLVQFKSGDEIIFEYETPDTGLASQIKKQSELLFSLWFLERPKITGPNTWATFAALCLASFYPTRAGGHAIIFSEVEKCLLLNG